MTGETKPTVIEGFWISERENRHRYVFDDQDLETVTQAKPGFERALRRLKRQSLNWVNLPWADAVVLVSEKKRPYPGKTPLDLMLLVSRDEMTDHLPESVGQFDVSSQELGNTLIYAKKMLEVLAGVARSFDKKVVKKAIAINFHQNPLPMENIGSYRKTYAQTIRSLHLHSFVLTEDDIKQSADQSLPKVERDIVSDPMSFVMKAISVIPSIQQHFLISDIDQAYASQLVFNTTQPIDSFRLASRLQILHQQYLTLYYELMSIFVDPNQEDMIGMPLLELEQMYANINVFIQNLRKNPVNQSSEMATHNIDRLAKIFFKLAGLIKEVDQDQIKNGERLFLRTAAYTLLLEPATKPGHWQITLDPRLISVGNAMDTYGYFKKVDPTAEPPREWWDMHKEMVKKVRRVKVNNGIDNFKE